MISKSTKLSILALSALVIFLLAFLALDVYNIRAQNEETSRLLNLADQAASEKALAQSARSFQNNARADIEVFEQVALTDGSLVSAIENIEEAGRSLGLKTEIVSVSEPNDGSEGGAQKITMVIETDGPWRGTYLFARAIESLPNRVMIEEIRFSKEISIWHSRVELSLFLFN